MKQSYSIQIKAAFLLIIFSLNMVVGFACSIGIDIGYNAPHHDEIENKIPQAHSHEGHAGKDHHGAQKSHDHKINHKENEDKKDCCNDEVQKVQQLDKNINNIATITKVVYAAVLPPSFFQTYIIKSLKANPINSYRERFFYPPPANILVEFQRFQI